jgi:PAS domain S-box-containing protein
MPALALFHVVLVLWRSGIWPLTFAITPLQFTASAMAVLISVAVVLVSQLVQRLQQAVARSTESEDRYRALFECAPVGIGLADSRGQLEAFNEAMLEPGGYTPADIEEMGSSVAAMYYDAAERAAVLEELARSGFVRDAEVRFKRKDGTPYMAALSLVPIPERSQILAIVQDITKRKESEAALKGSETFLRLSQEAGHIGSWEWNLATNDVRWSPEMYRIHRVDPDGFAHVVQDYVRFVHPDDRAKMEQSIADLRDGKAYPIEYRIIRGDHAERIVVGTSGLIMGTDGAPVSVAGTVQDITERKATEEALRESEQRFRALAEASKEGVIIHEQGVIREANDATARIMGLDPATMIGTNGLQYLSEETRARVMDHIAREESYEGQGVMNRPDGSSFEVDFSAAPIDYQGRPARVLTFRDVTERNQAERSLRESRQRLRNFAAKLEETREEERTTMSREIHDELGQTLTGLKMDFAWMAKHAPTNAEAMSRIESMEGLVDNMIQTVRDLAVRLRPGMLDDLGLVPAIDWQVREFRKRSNIRCDVRLPDDTLHVDDDKATAVFRILQEALTNVARHATATSVTIELTADDEHLSLTVCDDGIGVSEQAVWATDSIGLIGMRERAGGFGGRLDVERRDPSGTSVRLMLPR